MSRLKVRHCGVTVARIGVLRLHRHRSVPPRSALVAFEVVVDGWPRGWAMVGRPTSPILQKRGFVEVTRVAVEEGARNGCSILYGAAARWAKKAGKPIVTYTLATESGASLRGAGWVEVGRVKARGGKGWANRPGRLKGDGLEKIRWSPPWCADLDRWTPEPPRHELQSPPQDVGPAHPQELRDLVELSDLVGRESGLHLRCAP